MTRSTVPETAVKKPTMIKINAWIKRLTFVAGVLLAMGLIYGVRIMRG